MTIDLSRRSVAAGLAAALAAPRLGRAQGTWPERPIRLVVPFTPGGTSDILARAVANELQEVMGHPWVIENRGGAGGTLGTEIAARAEPDGHTVFLGHIGTLAVNPTLYPRFAINTATAFEPVVLLAMVANVLVVNPESVRARTVPELIAEARGRQMSFGSAGNGSASHLAMAAFNLAAGTEMLHVPYRGTAPMMADLMGGRVDMTMTGGPGALPPARAGRLRALGVSALERLASAPDIPTIAEQGLPAFEVTTWFAFVVPTGTPRAVIARLNADTTRVLTAERLSTRLQAEGASPAPGTPESLGRLIAEERTRWAEVVRRSGMRVD